RRYFRSPGKIDRGPRVNMAIRVPNVRLIDEEGEMVGVINTDDARRRADDVGMDLVEVTPDSDPPICKIIDYGRYKYDLSKKERANKAKTKSLEMKEVRLGRSMKIDPHDVAIRVTQAHKFLVDGHKVQIVQNFRGREMVHKERGYDRMKSIIERLDDVSKLETPPRMFGRRMTMILAPDKVKIAKYLRHKAKENPPPPPPVKEAKPEAEAPPVVETPPVDETSPMNEQPHKEEALTKEDA
ncbi:MAG: translation initiation factor IF-3, partial [Planctomycetota bacterium]|nr:translation initiation factor IF-3 [Planctomycetota bacterium]